MRWDQGDRNCRFKQAKGEYICAGGNAHVLLPVDAKGHGGGGEELTREHNAGSFYNHSPGRVAEFFVGLELVGPGLVDASKWSPARPAMLPCVHRVRVLAGVGRKLS